MGQGTKSRCDSGFLPCLAPDQPQRFEDFRARYGNQACALHRATKDFEAAWWQWLWEERLWDEQLRRDQINQRSPRDKMTVAHSITSSARPSSVIGTVTPSALAARKLIISWTFVARCTGKSAGFAPLRMRPA